MACGRGQRILRSGRNYIFCKVVPLRINYRKKQTPISHSLHAESEEK